MMSVCHFRAPAGAPARQRLLATLGVVAALWLPAGVLIAHEGEVHAEAAPVATASAEAGPSFVAASELFELVGRVEGAKLRIYLDRFADNTPVAGATLELDIGQLKLTPHALGDGEFEASLPRAFPPGEHAVAATVTAGADIDLLAATLVIPSPAAAVAPSHASGRFVAFGLAGFASLLVVGGLLLRRRKTQRERH